MAVKELGEANAEREARMCELRHKNIITYYGQPERRKGKIYIKMELARSNLAEFQETQGGSFPASVFLPLGLQVAEGLSFLHLNDVVHRDLKPQNVLVQHGALPASSVVLKLCDFGLSRFVGDDLFATKTVSGTPAYMAPEVAEADASGSGFRGSYELADVYSLGVVFHKMLYNALPGKDKSSLSEVGAESSLISSMIDPESRRRINSVGVVIALRERKSKCRSEHDVVDLRLDQIAQLKKNLDQQESFMQVIHRRVQQLEQRRERSTSLRLSPSQPNIWKKLVPLPELEKKLLEACECFQVEEVQFFLREGANINAVIDGWSPLQKASASGNLILAQLLIDKGAEINRASENGKTPLHRACQYGRLDMAKMLLKNHAETNKKDILGNVPLEDADPSEKQAFQLIFNRFE
jgi:serine/threonine protein kinase